eukprot:TRINITY_DN9608_c0_g1_i1.p2 TRINITY_DN9608_c0_g1~~TRINITY_DN9608_c0_g1_i1.p2  ORF type:complete len:205 (+),score=86.57 TRINITY_DN9608_c0_g1_i1:58-672(+)
MHALPCTRLVQRAPDALSHSSRRLSPLRGGSSAPRESPERRSRGGRGCSAERLVLSSEFVAMAAGAGSDSSSSGAVSVCIDDDELALLSDGGCTAAAAAAAVAADEEAGRQSIAVDWGASCAGVYRGAWVSAQLRRQSTLFSDPAAELVGLRAMVKGQQQDLLEKEEELRRMYDTATDLAEELARLGVAAAAWRPPLLGRAPAA